MVFVLFSVLYGFSIRGIADICFEYTLNIDGYCGMYFLSYIQDTYAQRWLCVAGNILDCFIKYYYALKFQ